MSYRSRMDDLTRKLRARTDAAGKPLPGYKQNVATLHAEIGILQEKIEKMENTADGE